jgi:phosphoribosylformylglycinamidine synthase I
MAKPRVLILKAAGINCDGETAHAFEMAGASPEFVHINRLAGREKKLSDFQIVAISGGFTYGDDIAAGKILANEIMSRLGEEVRRFIDQGGLMIGICNGFQVLVKTGLLPGTSGPGPEATLALNDNGVFQDRWVYLKASQSDCLKTPRAAAKEGKSVCVWTKGLPDVIQLPIAHGEGKFIPASEDILERMRSQGKIVFQYSDAQGAFGDFPVNPNGSIESVAGVCDPTGRIFGLMPHPERYVVGLQHPRWTREGVKKHGDGFLIFKNAVDVFK